MPFAELQLGPYGSDDLRVSRFTFEEGLSRPFSLHVEFGSEDLALDLDGLLGKPAIFSIQHQDGVRKVHGLVSQMAQTGGTVRRAAYEAEIVPPLWLLSQTADCRIFQNTDAKAVVSNLLSDSGLQSGKDFEFRLTDAPRQRSYCVQYRETDLDFASRLLEDEGVFYFFEHSDEGCKVVFADSAKAHAPIEGQGELRFASSAGMTAESEQVFRLNVSHRIRPGAVRLTDYHFEQPTLDLAQTSSASKESGYEIYDYPGSYDDPGVGAHIAQVRLEEARALRERGQGLSNCPRLQAGQRFDLVEHPRDDLNRAWVIVEVRHRGESPEELGEDVASGPGGGRYSNEFTATPHATPFRPQRVTPRPHVRGSQTAIVVGPGGSEVHCDSHSRVKVQFHWDRLGKKDENSSCWIRVSQPWAGAGWGGLAIPRVGQEVIIDFLEGDPDRPIMTGRVYNGDSMPPQTLPDAASNMTIRSQSFGKTGGSNEITMNDTTGKEGFLVHAQYDMNQVVENDSTIKVGGGETTAIAKDRTNGVKGNETISIGGSRTKSVDKDEMLAITGNRTASVGKDELTTIDGGRTETVAKDETISIKGNRTESVEMDEGITITGKRTTAVDKDETVTIGQNYNQSVGQDAVIDVGKTLKLQAGDEIMLETGSASITIKKNGDVTIKGNKINIDASGALTLKGSKITQN